MFIEFLGKINRVKKAAALPSYIEYFRGCLDTNICSS